MSMNERINKVTNSLIISLAVGITISGCGGGGGGGTSGTSIGTAVSSYLADQQGGGFVARWWYTGGVSSVAKADVSTQIPGGTNQYNHTISHKMLSSGTWGTDPNPDMYYDLISSGWIAEADTATLDATGGNNLTVTLTGEPGLASTVTRTDLANTAITCTSPTTGATVACPVPGNYPAGSASYHLTITHASNQFMLYGNGIAAPITDSSGTTLTTLPALNTTFCDPALLFVFDAQGSGVYKVRPTASCTSGAIATAIAGASLFGTVSMNSQATGNATVTNVLHVGSATGNSLVTPMVDMIYGLRAGSVWYGWMTPPGTYQSATAQNKTATNAQLVASGLTALP